MTQNATNQKRLRAAVIGAGVFGRFHAAKYKAMDGVDLVGIVDQSATAAAAAANDLGCEPYVDTYGLLGQIDLVTVATPAVSHAAAVVGLLENGAHAYVEKPIAANLPDADRILDAAQRNCRVIQVGHQERFVFTQMGILARQVRPLRISCHRAGSWNGRGLDVNVALDLMVHDIDLVRQISVGEPAVISAEARNRDGSFGDEIAAHLSMPDGCQIDLFASRIAEGRRRFMRLEYEDGVIFIDFIGRTIDNSTPEELSTIFGDSPIGVAADPLGFAVGDFVRCVRTGSTPLVTGQDGRRALDTTLAILAAANSPATREEAIAA
jgi:predicted dehydrogenase